jgi:integrase
MGRPKAGERIRGPYHDKSRARWRVDVFDPGECRPTCSYFAREGDALAWIERYESDLTSKARSAQEAFNLYEQHLRDKGTAEASIATTRWALHEFFPELTVLLSLDEARCRKLYDDLRTRPKRAQVGGVWIRPEEGPPLSADSHRGILKQAKSFLRWCADGGLVVSNPAEKIQGVGRLRPRGKSLGKSGTRHRIREARALYETTVELAQGGDQSAAIALTAILLGLRASEIVRRRVRDLDTDQADGDVLHVEDRKNGEDLEVEVPAILRPILLALAEGRPTDAYLFAHAKGKRAGKPFRRWYVREAVHAVCDAAEVPRITAHACRGLLATVAAERGMAGHLIAATLGNDERVMSGSYAAPGALEAGGRRRGLAVLQGGKR